MTVAVTWSLPLLSGLLALKVSLTSCWASDDDPDPDSPPPPQAARRTAARPIRMAVARRTSMNVPLGCEADVEWPRRHDSRARGVPGVRAGRPGPACAGPPGRPGARPPRARLSAPPARAPGRVGGGRAGPRPAARDADRAGRPGPPPRRG